MISARHWLPLILAVVLGGGSVLVLLQRRVDAILEPLRREEAVLYLPSGLWLKRLSLGYDSLLACFYWTRAVQHYGRERLAGSDKFPILYPLLDIATTLDPELVIAYRFGAIFLAERPPLGPGRVEEAVRLLQKGMAGRPDYWRFWGDLGFIYYWNARDYAQAAATFLEGSKRPGAPSWMKVMAARVATEGGERRTSMFLWREIHDSTDDPSMRRHALGNLQFLRAEEDMEQLEKLAVRYAREQGKEPQSFQDLIAAGYLAGVPVDPLGYPYGLERGGKARLHPGSPLVRFQPRRRR